MKKHIVIIAGLVMLSLSLAAQNQRETSSRVTETFNKTFPEARNVSWTLLKNGVRKAHFAYQGNSCIAFFSANARLISMMTTPTAAPLPNSKSLKAMR